MAKNNVFLGINQNKFHYFGATFIKNLSIN